MYIADFSNNVIRKVDTSGIIATVVGTGVAGYRGDGGQATAAQLNAPVSVSANGSMIIISDGTRVRKIY